MEKSDGRGKKICPKCSKVTGPRAYNCLGCDYKFFPDKEPKPKIIYQGLGPGKKKCPSCTKINAARQIQCECGYNFKEKKVLEVVNATVCKKVDIDNTEADWKSLNKGDVIEVLNGAGDHYLLDSGKVYMSDFGEYTVFEVKETGILATEYEGHGLAFINMVDNAKSISEMIKREKHKIKIVQRA